jgi:hypothetical protein
MAFWLVLASCASPPAPTPEDPARAWIEAIRAKVRSKIALPAGTPASIETTFSVVQLPNGEVLKVERTRSSGFQPYDEATEKAIWASSPLPSAPAASVFRRELVLVFRPR